MKLVKLSLAAAFAAGAFSVANATPLDEAIKDVDLKGALRYRYNNGDISKTNHGGFTNGTGGIGNTRQAHQFVGKLGFDAAIADNFKAFVEVVYNAGQESGFSDERPTVGTDTSTGFNVRQYYFTYTAEPVDTSILFGKMQVESIWTTSFLGLVGTGAKILNTSLEGTVLAAYAFDNFDATCTDGNGNNGCANGVEGDTFLNNSRFRGVAGGAGNYVTDLLTFNPYAKNLYGVAAIGSYDVGFGQLDPQLWLAYLSDTAFLYALKANFSTTFDNDLAWKVNFGYLGNAAMSDYKDIFTAANPGYKNWATSGNFVALNGSIEYAGFDAGIGGFYYGDKDQFSLTVLEDNGNIADLLAGREIYYTSGSNLTGDIGQNTFGFIRAGYTFDEIYRLGVDLVYGGTKIGNNKAAAIGSGAGDKFEAAVIGTYKYSPKLNFEAWYSYVDIDAKSSANDNSKNSFRFQALYKF